MNELLRIFDRLLKPSGYRIRKSEKYVLRPMGNLKELDEPKALARVHRSFDGIDMAEPGHGLDELIICYRTCLRSDRRPAEGRPGGADMEQVTLRCLNSLVGSVNHAAREKALRELRIRVFDDHSDASELDKIEAVLRRSACPFEIVTTAERGQGKSMHEHFKFGSTQDCLVYFCEDDYLHFGTAIAEMVAFYRMIFEQTGGYLLLHPQEQRKLHRTHYPSYVFKSDVRYWRTTGDMSHTLFTHGNLVRDHWSYFENTKHVGNRRKRHLGSERRTTNPLLAFIPGFCPMPALGGHFQSEDTLPHFFDWRTLWEQNDVADLLAGVGK